MEEEIIQAAETAHTRSTEGTVVGLITGLSGSAIFLTSEFSSQGMSFASVWATLGAIAFTTATTGLGNAVGGKIPKE